MNNATQNEVGGIPFPSQVPPTLSLVPCGVLGVVVGEAGSQKQGVCSKAHTVTWVLPFLLITFHCQVAATNVLTLNPFMESAIPSSAAIT